MNIQVFIFFYVLLTFNNLVYYKKGKIIKGTKKNYLHSLKFDPLEAREGVD
jgi:hypothetical protein